MGAIPAAVGSNGKEGIICCRNNIRQLFDALRVYNRLQLNKIAV
jgi:hypothetical protein